MFGLPLVNLYFRTPTRYTKAGNIRWGKCQLQKNAKNEDKEERTTNKAGFFRQESTPHAAKEERVPTVEERQGLLCRRSNKKRT